MREKLDEGVGCLICGVWKCMSEFSTCRPEMENRNIQHALKPGQNPRHTWGWVRVVKFWGRPITSYLK